MWKIVSEKIKDEKIYCGQIFFIHCTSYCPSHRCELLARKKVIFSFHLAGQLLGTEETGMAVGQVLTGNRSFL